jgi:hypothetical protein
MPESIDFGSLQRPTFKINYLVNEKESESIDLYWF